MKEKYETELEHLGAGIPEIEEKLKHETEAAKRLSTQIETLKKEKELEKQKLQAKTEKLQEKKRQIDNKNAETHSKLKTEALKYLSTKTKVDLLKKARGHARKQF